jgi:glycosyltransferase involved in cell wall biosynthesis
MSEPRVTVVVPAFRAEGTIRRALDSLRAQTCQDFETLVIDDGSPDETAAIVAAEYPEVRLIRQENAGVSRSRNRGAAEGRGEFVSFLDADDEWAPEKIERQLAVFAERPDVACCGTNGWVVVGQRRYLFNNPRRPRLIDLGLADLIWGYHPVLASLMIRRAVFLEIGGYDSTMAYHEDQEIIYRLAGAGHRIVELNEPLYIYHRHAKSRSWGAALPRAIWRVRALERWDPHARPDSPLTREQYVAALGYRVIVSAAECYREGGREHVYEILAHLDDVHDARWSHRFLLRLGQLSYPLFGVTAGVWQRWYTFVGALQRWGGPVGLFQQFWARHVARGRKQANEGRRANLRIADGPASERNDQVG